MSYNNLRGYPANPRKYNAAALVKSFQWWRRKRGDLPQGNKYGLRLPFPAGLPLCVIDGSYMDANPESLTRSADLVAVPRRTISVMR